MSFLSLSCPHIECTVSEEFLVDWVQQWGNILRLSPVNVAATEYARHGFAYMIQKAWYVMLHIGLIEELRETFQIIN